MKFKILSAIIETIKAGVMNAGNKYVLAEIIEDSPFAERSHKRTFFIPQALVPIWDKFIETGAYPQFDATYVVVKTAEQFRVKKTDGTLLPTVHDSMRILVRTDEKGLPIEDATSIADEIVETMMEKVKVSVAPVTPTVPAEPAAGGIV